MKKRILSIILTLTLTMGTCGIAVAAEGGGAGATRNSLKSYGSIEYHKGNDKVVINSEDLYMLADQIDQIKLKVTDQLEKMNTYFTAGSGISLGTGSDVSVTHTRPSTTDTIDPISVNFDTLLKGIAASQSIPSDVTAYGYSSGTRLYKGANGELTTNASVEGAEQINISAATANNLSAGTVAWVNGRLVLGTGGDNKAYNESGYKTGYKKGEESSGDLTDVISDLTQVGEWVGGLDGDIPYTFTPGKSVLMVYIGHVPSYTGTKNSPDAVFTGEAVIAVTIWYWEKNPNEKISVKITNSSAGYNTKLYITEW